MIGGIPGVGLGVLLFGVAEPDAIRVLIGLIALGLVAFQVARGQGWLTVAERPFSKPHALNWGLV